MSKRTFQIILAAVLMVANVAIYSCTSADTKDLSAESQPAEASGVESINDIPRDELTCYTGGKGEKECKVEPGIKIGDFVTTGCGVTCEDGYYACCGVRCICMLEEEQ